jgi:hypothetical protein
MSSRSSGFELHPFADGWAPLQAFVLIKSLDDEGEISWSFRTSAPFSLEELLGALTIQCDVLRNKLVRDWEDEDSEQ